MTTVRIEKIRKTYGEFVALEGLDLDMQEGEFVSFLGPSGCGKTTALRIVAGFESADSGTVYIDGEPIDALPPNKRDMGMVFQNYSLFPNMAAADNVAFGLRVRRQSADAARRRAHEMLELVGLAGKEANFPHQMSGGQQQRVALARALAIEPRVLLLDEPLSALDAKVRVSLRNEIRVIQKELGISTIFVTHDQEEALTVSDRIAVLSHGRLEQFATPEEIYRRPATPFVAAFVGESNRFEGSVVAGSGVDIGGSVVRLPAASAHPVGTRVIVLARPESTALLDPSAPGLPATVVSQQFQGARTRVLAHLKNESDPTAIVISDVTGTFHDQLVTGTDVSVSIDPTTTQVSESAGPP
ncbi:MAG: ABC transporter ATP-binding protein [Mycobacteriaceae bacterium]|nr:ABC transporter ATP-binding protein [Mycobacteriaceae bacterium]